MSYIEIDMASNAHALMEEDSTDQGITTGSQDAQDSQTERELTAEEARDLQLATFLQA